MTTPDVAEIPHRRVTVGKTVGMLLLLVVVLGISEAIAFASLPAAITPTTRLLIALCMAWPVLLLIAARIHGGGFRRSFQIESSPVSDVLLAILAGLMLGLITTSLITYIPTPPPESMEVLHETAARSNMLSLFLAMLLVGPAAEELFFRGWLMPAWIDRFGAPWGIAMSALLFALFHIYGWRVVIAFPIGLLLGWITTRTHSVIPAIFAHSAANGAPQIVDPLLALTGMSSDAIDSLDSVPLWIPSASMVILLLSAGSLGRMHRAEQDAA